MSGEVISFFGELIMVRNYVTVWRGDESLSKRIIIQKTADWKEIKMKLGIELFLLECYKEI